MTGKIARQFLFAWGLAPGPAVAAGMPAPWMIFSTPLPERTSDISMFRGDPRRQGYEPQPVSIDLQALHLRLGVNSGTYGASKSSVRAGEGRFFLASDRGLFQAVSGDGRVEWVFPSFLSSHGFHGTPALWRGLVIVGDYAGRLMALESSTGRLRWMLTLGNSIGASPLVTAEGKILISVETLRPDGFVARVDAASGRVEWVSDWLGHHAHSSPALDLAEGLVIVGANNGRIHGLDFGSGRTRWVFQAGGAVKGTAAITGGTAIVGSWDENLYALDVKTGAKRWVVPINGRLQGSLAIVERKNRGFFSTIDGLCKVNLKTGADLVCENRFAEITQRQASPVASRAAGNAGQDLIWTSCGERSFCVYDGDSLKRLRRWDFKSPLTNEPLIWKGSVYLVANGEDGFVVLRPRTP